MSRPARREPAAARGARRIRRQRPPSRLLPVFGWLLLLLGALALVVWRQTRGLELERALRAVQNERAVAEAERLAEVRRIQELSSRARVVRLARERLGMHLPSDREIVFIPVAEPGDSAALGAQAGP